MGRLMTQNHAGMQKASRSLGLCVTCRQCDVIALRSIAWLGLVASVQTEPPCRNNTYSHRIPYYLKLTPTHEEHNSINYLDLTIRRQHNKFNIAIYRKPTATDTTIQIILK